MSDASASSGDDGDDYVYEERLPADQRRYPVHDCCEYDDADTLRKLIFVPQESGVDDDDDDNDDNEGSNEDEENTDRKVGKDGETQRTGGADDSSSASSSDDNDSDAAAHAAAIGHSPQPLPIKVSVGISAPGMESTSDDHADKEKSHQLCQPQSPITSEEKKTSTQGPTTPQKDPDTGSKQVNIAKDSDAVSSPAIDVSSTMDAATEMPKEGVAEPSEAVSPAKSTSETPRKKSRKKKRNQPRFFSPYNLNERDSDEITALHVAIHARKLAHVRLLLEAGADYRKKSDGSYPIHAAISIGSVESHTQFAYDCTVLLEEHGADLSAKDDALHTPLYLACMFNLPRVAHFILSTETGLSTLNIRADRSGGRPLHAAAKFETQTGHRSCRLSVTSTSGKAPMAPQHDGLTDMDTTGQDFGASHTEFSTPKVIAGSSVPTSITWALLRSKGIEVDAINSVGQTPLHVACLRGNWGTVRMLIQAGASPDIADRRGFTPGQLAYKRGMLIPNDLMQVLGGPPSSGTVPPTRDLIVDPDSTTLLLTHELCMLHKTCPPILRDPDLEPPPENIRRLNVLTNSETGILRGGEFSRCVWINETRRAAIVDILKCHEYGYVETISQMCSGIPDHPHAVAHLDADTTMSRWSFEAALRAAGSVCEAVDRVVGGDHRNAFCAVRPPGHHAGPRGIVRCANDPEGGSHGFCLLNNVAIGAAYARSMYRNDGIQKVAIIDFDVHHGNGTEEIIRQLLPSVEKAVVRTPFAIGELASSRYLPWLDETDIDNVFFASTHGYGPRGLDFADTPSGGWFYPASGKSHISDAIRSPSVVETPDLSSFLQSQTWTRMGEESRSNCCKIINCGLGLPSPDAVPGMQRLELRDTYRQRVLPALREFDPDIIFVSAGFDAHKKDTMNFGYVGMVEDDYEWVTEQLVRIANTCCNGRIVSVLEGGYKIHGGIVSPFARSVASHVRALVDGGRSRDLYDQRDMDWESQFEHHLVDERERKRQQKIEKLRLMTEQSQQALYPARGGDDQQPRKRKRNQVDYRDLYEQMKREGFAG